MECDSPVMAHFDRVAPALLIADEPLPERLIAFSWFNGDFRAHLRCLFRLLGDHGHQQVDLVLVRGLGEALVGRVGVARDELRQFVAGRLELHSDLEAVLAVFQGDVGAAVDVLLELAFLAGDDLLHFAADVPVHHGVRVGAQAFAEFFLRLAGIAELSPEKVLHDFRALSASRHGRVDVVVRPLGVVGLGRGNDVGNHVIAADGPHVEIILDEGDGLHLRLGGIHPIDVLIDCGVQPPQAELALVGHGLGALPDVLRLAVELLEVLRPALAVEGEQLLGCIGIQDVVEVPQRDLVALGHRHACQEEAGVGSLLGGFQMVRHAGGHHRVVERPVEIRDGLVDAPGRRGSGEVADLVEGNLGGRLGHLREQSSGEGIAAMFHQKRLARRHDRRIAVRGRFQLLQVGNDVSNLLPDVRLRAQVRGSGIQDFLGDVLRHDVHNIGIAVAGLERDPDKRLGLGIRFLAEFLHACLDGGLDFRVDPARRVRALVRRGRGLVDRGLDGEDAPRGEGLALAEASLFTSRDAWRRPTLPMKSNPVFATIVRPASGPVPATVFFSPPICAMVEPPFACVAKSVKALNASLYPLIPSGMDVSC